MSDNPTLPEARQIVERLIETLASDAALAVDVGGDWAQVWHAAAERDIAALRVVLAALPTSWTGLARTVQLVDERLVTDERQRREAAERERDEARALHQELMFQVGSKFPDETRHETAKRYIRERELVSDSAAHAAINDALLRLLRVIIDEGSPWDDHNECRYCGERWRNPRRHGTDCAWVAALAHVDMWSHL